MSTYKEFVREFLAKEKASGNEASPTQRMVACAAAWRKEHPKVEKPIKTNTAAKDAKVTKAKNASVAKSSKKAFTFSGLDVGSMLFVPSTAGNESVANKSRKVFSIRKTKANQRQLNQAVRSFAKDVKLGAVTNVNEAFARGLKCLYDLHGHAGAATGATKVGDDDV